MKFPKSPRRALQAYTIKMAIRVENTQCLSVLCGSKVSCILRDCVKNEVYINPPPPGEQSSGTEEENFQIVEQITEIP
jgi:hypothetical protein